MKLTLGNQEIEITEEQRQKIAEALNLKATDEVDNWPLHGDEYWYFNEFSGEPQKTNWSDFNDDDRNCLEHGNIFRSEQDAQGYGRYLKALTRVKGSSSFVPDWDNPKEFKYFVRYDYDNQELHAAYDYDSLVIGVPVFYESKEAAEQAIKDHKEDFLILVGVK